MRDSEQIIEWYDWDDDNETLEERKEIRRAQCPRLTALQLEALWQLRVTMWDGHLISKTTRDELVNMGLAERLNGWQFITREGMAVLDTYGLLETAATVHEAMLATDCGP